MAKTYSVYLSPTSVSSYIDDQEYSEPPVAGPIASPGVLKKHKLYDCESTICLGKAGTKFVVQNFPIHWDYLKYVFETSTYSSFTLDDTTCQYFGYKPAPKPGGAVPTPKTTRSSAAKAIVTRRKSGSKAKQGNRVFFQIPAAARAQVTTGKTLVSITTLGTKVRRGGSLVFPNLATIYQIGVWFATHVPLAKLDEIGEVSNYRGSKILPLNPADSGAFLEEVGSFSTAVKNKLNDTLAVKNYA